MIVIIVSSIKLMAGKHLENFLNPKGLVIHYLSSVLDFGFLIIVIVDVGFGFVGIRFKYKVNKRI